MKKVFLIWWWVDSSNYKDFKEYLELLEYNPYEEKIKLWKDNLFQDLWEDYEVIKIPMPNKWFAEYNYWKIMFEKAIPYFWEKNILVGHSLWWSFILKYLNENNIDNISSVHLIAPAVFDSKEEKLWSFHFDKEIKNYLKYEDITTFYFSKDDEIVWMENYEYLKKVLSKSNFEVYENKGHFISQEHFEELVKNIKKQF